MKIKITKANAEKINAAIEKAEGKAKTRCLDYEDLEAHIKAFENSADKYSIPKSLWKGVKICPNTNEYMPAAYKHSYLYMEALIERCATGWFLIAVARFSAWPKTKVKQQTIWPPESKAKVVEKMLAFEEWE